MSEQAPPAAEGGRRITWEQTPLDVRDAIESIAGGMVVDSIGKTGGFSPGLASVLVLDNGSRVFAKAVNAERTEMGPLMNRGEIDVVNGLPASVPAPAFLGSYDDGDWVALVFEGVDGEQPAVPWRTDELDRVLDGVAELTRTLTPAPVELQPVFANSLNPEFKGWHEIADDAEKRTRLGRDWSWAADHLDTMLELEAAFPGVVAGNTLLHGDLRADNILLTDDRVLFVDWAAASLGAPHIDLMFMLPSMVMHGVDPHPIVAKHPVTRDLPDRTIDSTLAAAAGYFVSKSMLEPIPNLPTLREFQRAQGIATMGWLTDRLG